jgi:flagellar FliL protein
MAVVAIEQAPPPAKKGPSLLVQIGVLLAMTGIAIGGGWFAGGHMQSEQSGAAAEASAHPAPVSKPSGHGEAAGGHGEAPAAAEGHLTIIPLAPITTNLAQPGDVWVRMEVSLVFGEAPDDPALADSVHQDLLAFVRTLKLHQIEGASGFQHLRADLEERASIRSNGAAKRLLIRTLLLE